MVFNVGRHVVNLWKTHKRCTSKSIKLVYYTEPNLVSVELYMCESIYCQVIW